MTDIEKKLYEHLKYVLDSLETIFDTDGDYTETQLYGSLDSAREDAIYSGLDTDGDYKEVDWYNMDYLRKAMQGRSIEGVDDWGNLEGVANTIANAQRYVNAYEITNDL
jgi:hypothetical protein